MTTSDATAARPAARSDDERHVAFMGVHRAYDRTGVLLGLGHLRRRRTRRGHWPSCRSAASCPGSTEEAISAATSLSDDVIAVNICYDDPEDEDAEARFRQSWSQWGGNVPLITLRSARRSLGPPMVGYLRQLENEDPDRRLVVLIAELQPMRPWESGSCRTSAGSSWTGPSGRAPRTW